MAKNREGSEETGWGLCIGDMCGGEKCMTAEYWKDRPCQEDSL